MHYYPSNIVYWSLMILDIAIPTSKKVIGYIMKGHRKSWKVMEGHGRSFPDTRLTFQVRKVMGGWGGWWPVGLYCQPQSLSSGLWTLNLGLRFGTWIWDLGLGLGLDNIRQW